MFKRNVETQLLDWKNRENRKPLIIRGARQTGKTTLIREFAKEFRNFVEINLEKDVAQRLFHEVKDIKEVIKSIEVLTNQRIISGETLLFLDEIQNSIPAIKLLRYFHEEVSALHVISAGSLLEVRMKDEGWAFPVGRVEFLYLYPATFDEFLSAIGENILLDMITKCNLDSKISRSIHDKLMDLLSTYIIVGGMPSAINEYSSTQSFITLKKYQGDLIASFKEDFSKYSKRSEVEYLKAVWDGVPYAIGARIKYTKLSGGNANSKNISNAFDILHEAMLIERIFPSVSICPPIVKKEKSAPKPLFLDTGLCSYVLNLSKEQIKAKLIDPSFGGALFEEFTGQEILALDACNRHTMYFWIREEKGSSSELDFLLQIGNMLVPVEVKAGSHGSLKSLHQFLYRSKTDFGVRIYNGLMNMDNHSITLPNGIELDYKLLSIPFYLVFRLPELLSQLKL